MINKTNWRDWLELTKPRICMLSLMMTLLGFSLGSPLGMNWSLLLIALIGTALVGASCGALNMYLERDIDARMWRTMNRPLPTGRLQPWHALVLGFGAGAIGLAILFFAVNPLTAILGALTLFTYVGIYTPSKRVNSLSTLIGAVPGALPPLMGWTAATNTLSYEGLLLFAILFIWQIPHFLAIAWMYREDYARGELPILSVIDEEGLRTSKQVIVYLVALLPLTLLPSLSGITGKTYFFGALILGLAFLSSGVTLARHRSKVYARRLFFASILYLPALGLLMVWDRSI